MDYRKAWDEVKAKLEESIEEGLDNGYDKGSGTSFENGAYHAYKWILARMKELESQIPEKIKVGDTVRVLNYGFLYPSYSNWIRDNIDNPFLAAKWGRDMRLYDGATGIVRRIAPHGNQDRDLAYVEIGKRCFIIALEALELIEEG